MFYRKRGHEPGFAPLIIFLFFLLLIFGGVGISHFDKLQNFLCDKKNLGVCFENSEGTSKTPVVSQNNSLPTKSTQDSTTGERSGSVNLTVRLSEFSAGPANLKVDYDDQSFAGDMPISIQGQIVKLFVHGSVEPSSGVLHGEISGTATFTASDGKNSVTSHVQYTDFFTGTISSNNKASGILTLTQHVTAESSTGTVPPKTETIQIPWEGETSK